VAGSDRQHEERTPSVRAAPIISHRRCDSTDVRGRWWCIARAAQCSPKRQSERRWIGPPRRAFDGRVHTCFGTRSVVTGDARCLATSDSNGRRASEHRDDGALHAHESGVIEGAFRALEPREIGAHGEILETANANA